MAHGAWLANPLDRFFVFVFVFFKEFSLNQIYFN